MTKGKKMVGEKRIAILGAGISGLVSAYELGKKGFKVDIFEEKPEMAGFAGTFKIAGKEIEKYYHHFFKSDRELLALFEELGLSQRVRWKPSSMGYFLNGKVYDFGTPISLLKFSPLSFFGKIGFGLSTLNLLLKNDWEALEDVTAENWLKKNAGEEAYEKIWRPLLVSKFGERAKDVSMAWFWGKIKLRGNSKENGKEVLGYLDGSLKVFTDSLVEKIKAQGGRIHFEAKVQGLYKTKEDLWKINIEKTSEMLNSENGQSPEKILESNEIDEMLFMGIISAIPQPVLARIMEGDRKSLEKNTEKAVEKAVDHTAVICTVLVMNKPITSKYWLNIGDRGLPFGGLIEHTNYLSKEEYGGNHILYISSYMLEQDERYRLSEEELLQHLYKGLKKVNPDFSEKQVLESHIFKSRYAQPIITLGYSKKKPQHQVREDLKGLFQTSMAVIYPEDRGVNYSVRDSIQATKALVNQLLNF